MNDWMAVPRGQESKETEEFGISSFVYESRRPFSSGPALEPFDGRR